MISPEGISDWLCCRTAQRYPNRLSDGGGGTLCLESEIGARPPPASGVTFLFFLFLSHPLIENPSIGFSALYRSRHRLFSTQSSHRIGSLPQALDGEFSLTGVRTSASPAASQRCPWH